uniref:DAGKc domain-containing protein n=1 Tax=Leersia perrieri TaxID=77586 RepID=A0A0D9V6H9_9ORYZ
MGDHRATPTAKVRVNGAPAEATLFVCAEPAGARGPELRWRRDGGGAAECVLSLDEDVLGVEIWGKDQVVVKAFVAADAARSSVSCATGGGGRRRRRRDFVFEIAAGDGEDAAAAAAWVDTMRNCLDSLGRPKRLFILVNPFGGKKCARKIYEAEIRPLFEAAGVNVTMQETQYQGHAQEMASSLDLSQTSVQIHSTRVVNGILQRIDWEEAIKLPIGVVPAGTGNGMAKSLMHYAGHRQSLDVCTILQGAKKFFSVLHMTWGLVADIDIESEKYRWMGSARFDFYALVRIMNLRKYYGSIRFVPAPGYESYGYPVKQVDNCTVECQEQNGKFVCSYQGPLVEFQGSNWRSLDGPFVSVWINNVPWAAESIMAAPGAKFSDGYMDAIIVRDCPKADLLALLMKMSDGSHVKSPYVTYLKVRCFRLSPGQLVENPKRGGIIDVDGEVISRGEGTYGKSQNQDVMGYGPSIQMTVHQSLATVYCPR